VVAWTEQSDPRGTKVVELTGQKDNQMLLIDTSRSADE